MKKIYCLVLVVAMIACKDNDANLSFKEILLKPANGWVRTSELVAYGSITVDVFNDDSITPPCDRDDATVFASDGTYRVMSSIKCDDSETNPIATGSWSLSDDEKTLTVGIGTTGYTATILEADVNHIKATITTTYKGNTITATLTLVPKS